MAKKHTSTRRTSRTKHGITDALVDAAVEIGHAAEHLKTSLTHVHRAGEKGKRAIEPVQSVGKKMIREVRKHLPGKE